MLQILSQPKQLAQIEVEVGGKFDKIELFPSAFSLFSVSDWLGTEFEYQVGDLTVLFCKLLRHIKRMCGM